ncbi:MAG: alpha/beta hydrolase [Bacteroidetes bacterium]|nr:alpha/beta hydrolase [Bacteroidota bacterium]
MEKKSFDFDGILCTYFIEKNNKPTIFLVHGYCCDSRVWEEIIPTLREQFSLIVPDLIGYGESALGNQYSMEYLAEYIHAIASREDIDSFHYVGHSMGGYIGLAFLKKYPQYLNRFTLLNSHCFTDSEEKSTNREKTISFLAKHGSNVYENEIYKTLFSKTFYQNHAGLIEKLKARAKSYPVETLMQSCRGMIDRHDHSETLKNATIPIQFILGIEDSLIPTSDFLKQCAFPAISSIHLIEKMGHMGMLEEKEATILHISSFSSWANDFK